MLAEALAALVLLGVTTYAVLGGADFGGGVWTLFAGGPRARAQRDAIAHAMGPVWEANHVWLVFVIILVFTGFPPAFAILSVALFVPWHLVLVGIVARGAAFVFRAYGPPTGEAGRRWGTVFGVSSLLTPLILGMSLGAVGSGRIRLEGGRPVAGGGGAWLAPEAWTVGALAVAVCAYLAAVFLTLETTGDLRRDFRRRALGAWGVLLGLALLALPVFARFSPHLWEAFARPEAIPLLALEGAAALAALWALLRGRFAWARAAAVAQVAILVFGWGALLQFPYLIYPDLTLAQAAASDGVLAFTLGATAVGMLVLLPSLWLLFRVFTGRPPGARPSR